MQQSKRDTVRFGMNCLCGALLAGGMSLMMSGEAGAIDYMWRMEDITVEGGEWGNQFDGVYNLEDTYLPGVVDCENGAAGTEALKAQAVAARTFAYYKMYNWGKIQNGQGDQVFRTPGKQDPRQKHKDAVKATAGEILTFNGKYIASFYVAGSKVSELPLKPGDDTPKDFWWDYPTEKYVTYNYPNDKWGDNNQGSTLGSLANPINRGCMSQNGADYLADLGWNYMDILKYYYGGDIQLESVMRKTWTDQAKFEKRSLADFESPTWQQSKSKSGIFGHSPLYSGSNKHIGAGTTTSLLDDAGMAHSGDGSQKIVIDYDEATDTSDSGYFLRHVAGVQNVQNSMIASKTANVLLEAEGSVGVWLKTEADDMKVSIAVDDNADGYSAAVGTGDRGVKFDVIGDGEWHKYEWFFEDADYWEAWTGGGNGEIGMRFSLDSIQLFGKSDTVVYMDDVFYDMSAVAVPIPEPASLLVFGGVMGMLLRRRGK
ncbi:Stage II sporulation protein [Poriferisphaera corsica]|uniref:Stage II sporulation protein n=1 Tax=Poriferisphaera corsica TaxID=2528020 RepID=A0A517YYE1_9BACT|nr:SpoIID/LytB domain-containing protein [Poriferisphaera corsica]QDU35239.1 Stage II sporulation protein [Poriferisphaera corsica]